MGILLRVVLFFFSIAIVLIASLAILVGFEFYSQNYINGIIDSIYNSGLYKVALIAISLIFIIIAVYIFFRSLSYKKDNTAFSTNSTDSGQIKISVDTLENIALNAIKKVEGQKEPKVKVKVEPDDSVSVFVTILIDGEKSIPQISEEIQMNIKDSVEQIAGLSVKKVHVAVSDVSSNKVVTKKSRLE